MTGRSVRLGPRLALVLGVVLLAACAMASTAGAIDVRASRSSDLRPHAGARTEWWAVRAVNPATGAILDARLRFGPPDPGNVDVDLMTPDGALRELRTGAERFGPGVRVAGGPMVTTLTRRRGTYRMAVAGLPAERASLTVTDVVAGPTVAGWPSALGVGGWHVPVARGRARGVVQFDDGYVQRLDGWRASVEHVWGDDASSGWQLGEELAIHGRRRSALLFGRTPSGIPLADPERDRRFAGALVSVDRGRVRTCRPRISRRLSEHELDGRQSPLSVTARCGGRTTTIRNDGLALRRDFEGARTFHFGRGRASGPMIGLVRHVP